jgi:hypothetical protein
MRTRVEVIKHYTPELLAVDCPRETCKGKKNVRCMTANGRPMRPHAGRVRLMIERRQELGTEVEIPSEFDVEEPVRVVLVKPGEVLIIGGLDRSFAPEDVRTVIDAFQRLGVKVVLMDADITIGKTTSMAWQHYADNEIKKREGAADAG